MTPTPAGCSALGGAGVSMVSVMGVPLGRVLTVEMNRKGSAATVSGRFPRGYIWDIPVAYAWREGGSVASEGGDGALQPLVVLRGAPHQLVGVAGHEGLEHVGVVVVH